MRDGKEVTSRAIRQNRNGFCIDIVRMTDARRQNLMSRGNRSFAKIGRTYMTEDITKVVVA
jgi:hypothetical protein